MVERALPIIQLVGLRASMRLRLARGSLDGLLSALSAPRNAAPAGLAQLEQAMACAEPWIDRVPGIGKSCLYRALGRYGLLCQRGFRPEFVMGVDPGDPERAHAWVELNGSPYRERLHLDWVVTFRFVGRAALS